MNSWGCGLLRAVGIRLMLLIGKAIQPQSATPPRCLDFRGTMLCKGIPTKGRATSPGSGRRPRIRYPDTHFQHRAGPKLPGVRHGNIVLSFKIGGRKIFRSPLMASRWPRAAHRRWLTFPSLLCCDPDKSKIRRQWYLYYHMIVCLHSGQRRKAKSPTPTEKSEWLERLGWEKQQE
jgi:hypothetical protein